MSAVKLDEYEKEVVRHLAQRFNEGELYTSEAKWPRANENCERAFQIRNRFEGLGWLYWESGGSFFAPSLRIHPTLLEVVHDLENPPRPDLWAEWTAWFRSKWWSLPVLLVFLGVPAIAGWVQGLIWLLQYMGVIPKE
jgi:hypothetical protein